MVAKPDSGKSKEKTRRAERDRTKDTMWESQSLVITND